MRRMHSMRRMMIDKILSDPLISDHMICRMGVKFLCRIRGDDDRCPREFFFKKWGTIKLII